MSDYTKQIKDALDIIKYDSDIADTLSELRGKWDIPALRDPRLDSVAKQYITLPHTEGVDALGQELSNRSAGCSTTSTATIYTFLC